MTNWLAKQLNGNGIWSCLLCRPCGVSGKGVICSIFLRAPVNHHSQAFQNLLRELLLQLNVGARSVSWSNCPKAGADVGTACLVQEAAYIGRAEIGNKAKANTEKLRGVRGRRAEGGKLFCLFGARVLPSCRSWLLPRQHLCSAGIFSGSQRSELSCNGNRKTYTCFSSCFSSAAA